MPTMSVMAFPKSPSREWYVRVCSEPSSRVQASWFGPLDQAVWGCLRCPPYMANYDAKRRAACSLSLSRIAEKHGVTNLAKLNLDLISQFLQKARSNATIYVGTRRAWKHVRWSPFNTQYFENFLSSRTVFRCPPGRFNPEDSFVLKERVLTRSSLRSWCGGWKWPKYYDFIESCLVISPLIAKEQVKDGRAPDHHQELDWGGRSQRKPVSRRKCPPWAWGRDLSEIIVRSLGQGHD